MKCNNLRPYVECSIAHAREQICRQCTANIIRKYNSQMYNQTADPKQTRNMDISGGHSSKLSLNPSETT